VADRDFLWLLVSRLVVNIGNAFGTSLLLFFLLYGVQVPSPRPRTTCCPHRDLHGVRRDRVDLAGMLSDRPSASAAPSSHLTAVSAVVQAVSGVVILISPFEMTRSPPGSWARGTARTWR
jgi:hypothetical protein